MAISSAYLVNIPIALSHVSIDRAGETLERIKHIKEAFGDKPCKFVLGFNSIVSSAASEAEQLRIRAVVTEILGEDVSAEFFTWTPRKGNPNVNYCDIRNKMMCRQVNRDFHQEFSRRADIQKIFYVSIDPDTTFTKETLQQFERKTTSHTASTGICPLLSTGFYKYDVPPYSQDIPIRDEVINWEELITQIESEAGAALKAQLSSEPLSYTKHPLTRKEFLTCSQQEIEKSLREAQNLVYWLLTKCAIQQSRRQIIPDGPLKQKLKAFQRRFQICHQNPHLSRAIVSEFYEKINELKTNPRSIVDDPSMDIDKLRESLEKINLVKTISYTDLLYPTEPVMFVSLFQRDILNFSSLLNDQSNPFGSAAGSMEGPKLVIKLKQLWKQQLSLKTREQRLAARACKQRLQATGFYSSIDFSYTTATPQRNKEAAANSVRIQKAFLPRTKSMLSGLLQSPKGVESFSQTLGIALSHQPQSAFGRFFGDMMDARIELAIDEDQKKRFSIATQQCLPSTHAIADILARTREVAKTEIIQSLLAAIYRR